MGIRWEKIPTNSPLKNIWSVNKSTSRTADVCYTGITESTKAETSYREQEAVDAELPTKSAGCTAAAGADGRWRNPTIRAGATERPSSSSRTAGELSSAGAADGPSREQAAPQRSSRAGDGPADGGAGLQRAGERGPRRGGRHGRTDGRTERLRASGGSGNEKRVSDVAFLETETAREPETASAERRGRVAAGGSTPRADLRTETTREPETRAEWASGGWRLYTTRLAARGVEARAICFTACTGPRPGLQPAPVCRHRRRRFYARMKSPNHSVACTSGRGSSLRTPPAPPSLLADEKNQRPRGVSRGRGDSPLCVRERRDATTEERERRSTRSARQASAG
jgi:hypothetical protein